MAKMHLKTPFQFWATHQFQLSWVNGQLDMTDIFSIKDDIPNWS